MPFRLIGRSHGMVAGYRSVTSKALASFGAAAVVCVIAGLMLPNLWPEKHSPATIPEPTSDAELSALELLRSQVKNHPKGWRWSLLLAYVQHQNGDRKAAFRTLKPLRILHPDDPEVTALWSLLALEADQGVELIKKLQEQFESTAAEKRLGLGLLLADIERLSGKAKAAASRYRSLIKANPQRPEPLLALALLKKDQGNGTEAIALLRKATTLKQPLTPNRINPRTLELLWGLEAARNSSFKPGLKAVTTP